MSKNRLRMFLEIKNKENKTELEELYLTLKSYNFIACELEVSIQKLEIGFNEFVEKRKNNYSKNITLQTEKIITKHKEEIEIMKETTKWDMNNITFEQIFLLEFEQAIKNIIKDLYYKRFDTLGGAYV